ncbi:MAG: 30S ribosomal protein S8 [Gammaproteobacteria bacterium]|nr:30S ribosomal protein S8 [Gammaproteobacteria bacterium]MCW5582485.1 30S ribosomal protein S8 [Gammaproteobacteria bacterium]
MSMQDPVADMLTCIRNAQAMGIQKIRMPHSNLKKEILKVLKEEGFIGDFEVIESDKKKDLHVVLKYYQGRPVIEKIHRVSRPALRVYKGCDKLPVIRGGLGIAIVSTPKGVMSDKTARTQQVGGEVLCTVE